MRLRWLLLAVVTMSLMPSLASARSPIRRPMPVLEPAVTSKDYSIGTAINEETKDLVLAIYNPNRYPIEVPVRVVGDFVDYDWLTVTISNATTSRTINFIHDREHAATQTARIEPGELHFETIDLGPDVDYLTAGDYDVHVTWDGHTTSTTLTSTYEPMHCGLSYRYTMEAATNPAQPKPATKWPYILGGFAFAALLAALLLGKRAGTASVRVPCSPL